jgi:hypothetical protein
MHDTDQQVPRACRSTISSPTRRISRQAPRFDAGFVVVQPVTTLTGYVCSDAIRVPPASHAPY